MLKNGTYAAWFKTPLREGTGIAHVLDGRIWGRDAVMTYDGACQVDGDRFTADLSAKIHTEGLSTVFGSVQELKLKLDGQFVGRLGSYTATAEGFPELLLQGTLILREPASVQEPNAPSRLFDPERLPKLPKRARF